MKTLQEFGTAVDSIRQVLEHIKIEGTQNASLLVYCSQKCNEIIKGINEAMKTAPPGDIEVVMSEPEDEKEDGTDGNDQRKP